MQNPGRPDAAQGKGGMRVLFCRSNPISPDPRVEKEARALCKAGYAVEAVCWDRAAQLPAEEDGDGFRIHRILLKAAYGHGLNNLPQLLRWQWALLAWLARRHRDFDLLHACDFDTILPALLCKLLWQKVVVYDVFDFYADHLRNTPSLIKRLIRWTDLRAIDQADALILVDESRRQQVQGSSPKRVAIIYNTPAEAPLSAVPIQANSCSLRLAYVGLLQIERGLLELLDVLSRHPDWKLDLAGFGGDEARLLQAARSLPNVAWHGRISYPRALELSAAADALFATYDPVIPNHKLSSPNKLFEALMLGKPIVVARDTNIDRIVEQWECGLVVKYGSVPELESALERLAANPDLRARLGQNARRAYNEEYSWARMEGRLLELYSALV